MPRCESSCGQSLPRSFETVEKGAVKVFGDEPESNVQRCCRDPLFLLACAVAWRTDRNLDAGWELIQAVKDSDPEQRTLALDLLGCVAGYSRPLRPKLERPDHPETDVSVSSLVQRYSPAESWR
jgi:hypothetical protein